MTNYKLQMTRHQEKNDFQSFYIDTFIKNSLFEKLDEIIKIITKIQITMKKKLSN